jgi:cell wall assembly regulator SMI1
MKRIHKIGIGIVIAIVVVMAAGYWAVKKTQTFTQMLLYPHSPPMPPIVSDPMPEILGHLESVLKTNAPQVLATLRPGISSNQISQLEQQYRVQVPEDIKTIYEWHDGAVPMMTTNYLDFIPIHRFVPLEEMLSEKANEKKGMATATSAQRAAYRVFAGYRNNWYCLFDDGSGNGYFFDPTRKPAEGALFCVFVEDNDFTFFPSAKNLMAGIAKCYEQSAYRVKPGSSHLELDEDYEQSKRIWKEFGASNQEASPAD